MSKLYRLALASTRRAVPAKANGPICIHCANGYHEEILFEHERCSCPCHGGQTECVIREVAA